MTKKKMDGLALAPGGSGGLDATEVRRLVDELTAALHGAVNGDHDSFVVAVAGAKYWLPQLRHALGLPE